MATSIADSATFSKDTVGQGNVTVELLASVPPSRQVGLQWRVNAHVPIVVQTSGPSNDSHDREASVPKERQVRIRLMQTGCVCCVCCVGGPWSTVNNIHEWIGRPETVAVLSACRRCFTTSLVLCRPAK
jgi:hypothetical protein